jgi:hypothetical protein
MEAEEDPLRAAARAAYDAACRSDGRTPDTGEFSQQTEDWIAIARAARQGIDTLPDTASQYTRNVLANGGLAGMEREAERLLHKMRTAASLYRDGRVKAILTPTDDIAARVSAAAARGDVTALAVDLDIMQARIVQAQALADPGGRAALVLNAPEREWERYESYIAYRESFKPRV